MGCRIVGLGIDRLGSLSEGWCHIGDKPQADANGDDTDNQRLYHISLRIRQYHHEHIEHSSQRGQRQELITGQGHSHQQCQRDQDQRGDKGRWMTDHQRRRHADIHFLTSPFLLHHLLRLLSNRFQTVDEEFRDTRN